MRVNAQLIDAESGAHLWAEQFDDPNNAHALTYLGLKYFFLAALGGSGDPKGDLQRADELESKALARYPEAVAEHERALALDPSNVGAAADLGWDYGMNGQFDKGLEYFDKAILGSPHDPLLATWYGGKAQANFGLKNYDQAIELARQAIAINPNYVQYAHAALVAALALSGHDAEAREALQRYLALPSTGPLKAIAAWKAYYSPQGGGPPRVEANERTYEGLRKAGMAEE
jgi:tetratricopeptide (TPR) repeat protein